MNLDDFDLDDKIKARLQKHFEKETAGLVRKKEELMEKFLRAKSGAGFGDFYTDALSRILKQLGDQGDTDLMKQGKIDELIALKVKQSETQRDDAMARADTTQIELDKQKASNQKIRVENQIRLAAGGIKDLLPTAVDDVVTRAMQVWQLHEGTMKAYNGDKQIFNEKSEPIKPGEWIDTAIREVAPHYFGKGSGTGAQGGQGSGESYETYYDRKGDGFNLTKQAELAKENPELHKQLKTKHARGATH